MGGPNNGYPVASEFVSAEITLTDVAFGPVDFSYAAMNLPAAPDFFAPLVTASDSATASNFRVIPKAGATATTGQVTAIPAPSAGKSIKVRILVKYIAPALGAHV